MAAAASEQEHPSILARVDRLDIMLGYLEELRGSRGGTSTTTSASSASGAVTASSDGGNSSANSSPRSIDRRRCRPIGDVVVETQVKGNLIHRIEDLEIRLLKLEKGTELEKREREEKRTRKREKRGLKRLVAHCLSGDLKTKE
ncbi:hypothetical protein Cni_G04181 [Canna indica]|uniref:Uncharacterized protein n=1 Tax=Canna indica TaxID=4628 RepID=A0AAQ3JUX0_9LILI|nr:hypothetical protein Cni_G04181 [Canna indica]